MYNRKIKNILHNKTNSIVEIGKKIINLITEFKTQ